MTYPFRDEFAAALDPRFYTIDYLDEALAGGLVRLMVGNRSAIVVEIKQYPTGTKAVCGVIAAGDADEIATSLIPQAEEWGASIGCTFGMIDSRPGWARVMKKHGYETHQVSIVKEL